MRIDHRLFRAAVFVSAALLLFSGFAWIEAIRLPEYANYWEWRDGWYVGVRNAGDLHPPDRWHTYLVLGHFPDRGQPPTVVTSDVLTSPSRWPDLDVREVRLLWPLTLSLIVPAVAVVAYRRRTLSRCGFPVDNAAAD